MALRCKRRRFVVLSSDSEGSDYDNDLDMWTGTALRVRSQALMPLQVMRKQGGRSFQHPPPGVVVIHSDSEEDGGIGLRTKMRCLERDDEDEDITALNPGLLERSRKKQKTTAQVGNAVQTGSRNENRPLGRMWFDHVAGKSRIITETPRNSSSYCI